jgi:ankyrin repeat protein
MSLVNGALETEASLETIIALMQRGDFVIDFQAPPFGTTPLFAAIRKLRIDVAVDLILRGANVELGDRVGNTPLLVACSYNLLSTAQALVQAGAVIDRANYSTPLGCAAVKGHLLMVRALLSWGADPNGMGTSRATARALAIYHRRYEVVKFLYACNSMLVVRSAEEVRRVAKDSALKLLPKDLGRLVGEMLV